MWREDRCPRRLPVTLASGVCRCPEASAWVRVMLHPRLGTGHLRCEVRGCGGAHILSGSWTSDRRAHTAADAAALGRCTAVMRGGRALFSCSLLMQHPRGLVSRCGIRPLAVSAHEGCLFCQFL
eukprot:TRINITY_DN12825_c0_g1_i1.p5 TRINITY_DN12825_c0_g1~~TRINITY_DN12825_c0_g1_i1.p5  ORF type:complete len:124 (+),score=5.78 TRINITY_DN12825_c0_g1_i1:232-603(+)